MIEYLASLVIAVIANIVSHIVCKWWDGGK